MRTTTRMLAMMGVVVCATSVRGQGSEAYVRDPVTGITYRKVARTVEQPVVDVQTETKELSSWRPELVTTVRDEQQTYYSPVVTYQWQPKWHGTWNPFSQPTLAYHLVPTTQWEARVATVQRPQTQTRWIEQKEVVQVPRRSVRIERKTEFVYEPVNVPVERLQSVPAATPNLPPAGYAAPLTQVASRNVGGISQMASDPPRRSTQQGGLPATVLGDSSNPAIATAPPASMWR